MRHFSRRGAATVEMALVLPLLLALVLGVVEYGWMFLKFEQVANAARQGVRAGIVAEATATSVTSAVSSAMSAAGLASSGYTVTITPSNPMTLEPGQLLRVAVSVPYANIELVGTILLPTPTTLRSTVVMSREGP